ncbi:GNAT family N-acetyltransferase [Microbulbifer elongatus]|uniref:GNAT family N-acetyltransferase n=1 Tax=Microbulbifer elongatus TaxID=86173 RepID=UPI001CFD5BEA|nr:N-acetyltransferase [Microbulbifer elongatus]
MNFSIFTPENTQEVINVFTTVFSASEGEEEGRSIGNLVSNLITKTDPDDLIGFVAVDKGSILGAIFFSRLTVPSGQVAYILSPVAIATEVQGTGIGQRLINYGLAYLKSQDVSLVFTYGDPRYYSKTGFQQISEKVVQAPFPLSQPIGWLAQSLDGEPIKAMSGSSQCVEALSDPGYW